MDNEEKKLVYIYNGYEKQFLLKKGVRMVDAGLHHKTNKLYWVFVQEEIKPFLDEWFKTREEFFEKIDSKNSEANK